MWIFTSYLNLLLLLHYWFDAFTVSSSLGRHVVELSYVVDISNEHAALVIRVKMSINFVPIR